jgi:hypothetical protein
LKALPAQCHHSQAIEEVAYLAWETDGKIDGCLGFLAGDVLPMLRDIFLRAEARDGQLYCALYELCDPGFQGVLRQ